MFKRLKKFSCTVALALSMISCTAQANIWESILQEIQAQTGIEDQIRQYTQKIPDLQQQTINQLINTKGLDFASLSIQDNLQSWGNQANTWDAVKDSYQQSGSGVSTLAKKLNQTFPVQDSQVANPNPNSLDARYYTLQAKTALATRAASQWEYDHLQQQMDYMHQLRAMIAKTQTLKDAMDLQNRIQVEGNLIDLELLRLSALSTQQAAVNMQGKVNAVVNNARAFQ